MSRKTFPLITDYARNALVAVSPSKGFTPEQLDKQQELRSELKELEPGLVLPHYTTETRGLTATGGDGGSNIPGTDVPEIGSALRGNLVLEQLGARVFGGLVGNFNLPRAKTGISASWLSENAAGTPGSELFATLSM